MTELRPTHEVGREDVVAVRGGDPAPPGLLHRCEARGQQVVGGPLVDCARPGTIYVSPVGRGYWLCDYHGRRFEEFVCPIAEAATKPSPEGASTLQRYDGDASP